MGFLEGALNEGVHHIAGTPDAHAYAHFAVFFCGEGVTALGISYDVQVLVVTFLVGKSRTKSYHAVGCSDFYSLSVELLHGVLGEFLVKHA